MRAVLVLGDGGAAMEPMPKAAAEDVIIRIETPRGAGAKYTFDPASGGLILDRPIHTALRFPCDYGYVPNTLAGDGDPLDAVLLIDAPVLAGCLVRVRIIGCLEMEDEGGRDDKLICVAVEDPRSAHIVDIEDVPPHQKEELRHFFVHVKDLEADKWARVHDFKPREYALAVWGACRGRADS